MIDEKKICHESKRSSNTNFSFNSHSTQFLSPLKITPNTPSFRALYYSSVTKNTQTWLLIGVKVPRLNTCENVNTSVKGQGTNAIHVIRIVKT